VSDYTPQTARETLERIQAGTRPWVAIGDLLDDWRRVDDARRRAMIEEPLGSTDTLEQHRWAAFIAAAVDQLAWEADPRIEPPAWVRDRRYVLPEPWFLLPGWRLRMHQLVDTPAAFTVRNIYGGDRIIARV
jgi:hypothetical protein